MSPTLPVPASCPTPAPQPHLRLWAPAGRCFSLMQAQHLAGGGGKGKSTACAPGWSLPSPQRELSCPKVQPEEPRGAAPWPRPLQGPRELRPAERQGRPLGAQVSSAGGQRPALDQSRPGLPLPDPSPSGPPGTHDAVCTGRGGRHPGEGSRDGGYLRGGARWIYLEHFGLPGLLVRVLLTALLAVVLVLPLRPDFRGPARELSAALSTLGCKSDAPDMSFRSQPWLLRPKSRCSPQGPRFRRHVQGWASVFAVPFSPCPWAGRSPLGHQHGHEKGAAAPPEDKPPLSRPGPPPAPPPPGKRG